MEGRSKKSSNVQNSTSHRSKPVKNQSQKFIFKNYISSPYNLQWSVLSSEDNQFILQQLIRYSPGQMLRKRANGHIQSTVELQEMPSKSDQFTKDDIVVGINAVIRALEKQKLSIALICNSINSQLLRRQLLILCATNTIHAACVNDLSKEIAPRLGINSAIAIGIKKSCPLTNCINSIRERISQISYPWIPTVTNFLNSTPMHDNTSTDVPRPLGTEESSNMSNNDSTLPKEMQNDIQTLNIPMKNSLLESDTSTSTEFYRPLYVKRLKSTPKGKKKK